MDAVKDWGKCHVNYFARIYVSFLLSALARHIKKVLTNFFKDSQGLLAPWPGNQLAELLSLSDELWLDLFRFKPMRRKTGDVSLNCCGSRGATFLSTLSTSTGDPLQPTYFAHT